MLFTAAVLTAEVVYQVTTAEPIPYMNGILVTTSSPISANAGLEMLQSGGGAVDAAVTTALAQVVEAAGCYVSAAGIMTMIYYESATGKTYYLNAGYNVPLEEKDGATIPKGKPSGRSVLVPGFMAGMEAAHKKFGKKPWKQLFDPAIKMAEHGTRVNEIIGPLIAARKSVLERLPDTKSIFTKPDGTWYSTGELFKQPELAKTYRAVAERGAREMSSGAWGQAFVTAVQTEGGKLQLSDVERYSPMWQEPIRSEFRNYDLVLSGHASIGGVALAEAMNLVEIAALRKSGHYTESAHTLANLQNISHSYVLGFLTYDVQKTYFGHDLSPESRVKKETSTWIWNQMKSNKWPWGKAHSESSDLRAEHSDGIVVVDDEGNVVALTHTINTISWGNTGIFVGGISIPDSGAIQPQSVARAGPGGRLPDTTCPLIVLKNGKPILASSTIGNVHSKTFQVLTDILEFDQPIQRAANSNALLDAEVTARGVTDYVLAGSIPQQTITEAIGLGQQIKVLNQGQTAGKAGWWVGVRFLESGKIGAGTTSLPIQVKGY